MSSKPADSSAEEADPNNALIHRMRVKRLEGEAIRDSILAVSGRLDSKMYGPSIPIYLTPFMDGRGRPGSAGPLDGEGRRSIYVEVRRNFLSPMMLAFDTPIPASTVGRRTVSNVPAQALILLNDPFVAEQTRVWAKKIITLEANAPERRIQRMYLEAFARPPEEHELTEALAFMSAQGRHYGISESQCAQDERVWADIAHVLLNVKEFIFVN